MLWELLTIHVCALTCEGPIVLLPFAFHVSPEATVTNGESTAFSFYTPYE